MTWPLLEETATLWLYCIALVIGGIIGWLARGFAGNFGVETTMASRGPVKAASAQSAAAVSYTVPAAAHDLKTRQGSGMKGDW